MLNKHEDWFEDLNLPRDTMKQVWGGNELTRGWSNYDVGYQLYTNDEFNIRVAGSYLAHLKSWLEEKHLPKLGVTITDENIGTAQISTDDLWKLTLVGYNQGTGYALARLQDRYNRGGAIAATDQMKEILDNVGGIFGTEHNIPNSSDLAGLQADLTASFGGLPDQVPGTDVEAPQISKEDLNMLAIAAHNLGWGHTLEDLEEAFRKGGPSNVMAGISNTLDIVRYIGYVSLFSDEALIRYGLYYEEGKNRE